MSPQAFATRHIATPARRQFTFGPGPRPALSRNTAQHVGLSSARNFSSAGQGVFANVVANAPLALRALGDELRDGHSYGIDQKRWTAVRRAVRSDMKREAARERLHRFPRLEKAEVIAAQRDQAFLSRCDEFRQYFSAGNVAGEAHANEPDTAAERLPVVLAITAEPEVYFDDFDMTESSMIQDPTSWRVLSRSTVSAFSAITRAHEQHAHRIRALHNRLWAAGVFDPNSGAHIESDQLSSCGRRREVHIVFDPAIWDIRDVKSAVGEWHSAASWFRIVDLQAEADTRADLETQRSFAGPAGSLLEDASYSGTDSGSDDVHLEVTHTLVLPRMDLQRGDQESLSASTFASSLELSPPASSCSISSFDDSADDGYGMDAVHDEDGMDAMDDVQREWEDARDEWQTQESVAFWYDALADSYEEGVHEFLKDLDEVEQEISGSSRV